MESNENDLKTVEVKTDEHKSNIFLRWQESRIDNVWTSVKIIIFSFPLFFILALSNIGRSSRVGATEIFFYAIILCAPFALAFLYTISGYYAISEQMSVGIKKASLKLFTFLLGGFEVFFILATILDVLDIRI